jgi:hypothetical protein
MLTMSKNIINQTTDTIYGVGSVVKKFEAEHPDETVIMAAATKAQKMDSESTVRMGVGWAFSRRGTLILTETAFYCRDWVIPIDKLKYAEIAQITSVFGAKAAVIKLADNTGYHYQFGLNDADAWLNQNIVSFKQQEVSQYYRIYIWAARLVLIAFAIYWIFNLVNG